MTAKALLLATAVLALPTAPSAETLAQGFARPPLEARPMVRWWWFGPAVTDSEIVREIKMMKAGGFGGFEIQPVYPLTLDDPAKGLRNLPYLSDDFLKEVRLANDTGRAEGMRVDITLGSGWPYGGPHTPVADASSHILLSKIAIPAHAADIALPTLTAGQHIVAAFAGKDPASAQALSADLTAGHVAVTPADEDRTLFVVLQTPTGQQVKRPSVGAEGNVLDHMSAEAVQNHLHSVADRLMTAFGDHPPYSVFSDSLEVYGADWTDDLLPEFKKRRGYDLTPRLLDLFSDGEASAAVRHDWALTLSELTEDRYLTPINDWARAHDTRFRSQTYGIPPVRLSSNARVALPEGEGPQWRKFTTTRWASSANHIYGNPVTSAESWTWLHGAAFRATPLDIKAEADTLMLEGVNQFIAHGWPYTPPGTPEPGWALYAAAVFNEHNPWWGVMPDVTAYLQRMSYLLRQGENVADVAVFLPTDDALAAVKPGGNATVNGQMSRYVTDGLTAQILDAGFNFDYVDSQSVMAKGVGHKVLILPHVSRIDPSVYKAIDAFARSGGIVIAVDGLPDTGAGLSNAEADTQLVRAVSGALFAPGAGTGHQAAEAELGKTLRSLLPSDLGHAPPGIGFVHRRLADGDLYFVANTTNQPVTAPLSFRTQAKTGQWWEPRSGAAHVWKTGASVTLAPYESRVFVFGKAASAPVVAATKGTKATRRTLTGGWRMAFKDQSAHSIDTLASWTSDPATEHYSGVATYSRTLTLSKADIAAGLDQLDFGEGEALPPAGPRTPGTSALLAPPMREAAEVYVNGKRAGAVWTAPFSVSLRGLVHAGDNQLDIRVANTAVNLLAGRPNPDYSALNAKYGERFQAQGMDNLKPLPSGLLQAPTLRTAR